MLDQPEKAIEKIEELAQLGIAFYSRYALSQWFERDTPDSPNFSQDRAYSLAVDKIGHRTEVLREHLQIEMPELF